MRISNGSDGSIETGGDINGAPSRDRALNRIMAEIYAGLRHGYFEYAVTCEVIAHGRRRLVLRAGKNYQFVIPGGECEAPERSNVADRTSVDDS
jgi:hypothetical protein